jgi:hypothetical protein
MKEKCCIFYFYATLFSFLYAFCYFQTSPLGVRQSKAFCSLFCLFAKTSNYRLLFLFTRKASLRVIQSQNVILALKGRITEHIELLVLTKAIVVKFILTRPSGKPTARFETSEKFFLSP